MRAARRRAARRAARVRSRTPRASSRAHQDCRRNSDRACNGAHGAHGDLLLLAHDGRPVPLQHRARIAQRCAGRQLREEEPRGGRPAPCPARCAFSKRARGTRRVQDGARGDRIHLIAVAATRGPRGPRLAASLSDGSSTHDRLDGGGYLWSITIVVAGTAMCPEAERSRASVRTSRTRCTSGWRKRRRTSR